MRPGHLGQVQPPATPPPTVSPLSDLQRRLEGDPPALSPQAAAAW